LDNKGIDIATIADEWNPHKLLDRNHW
jgi:hypothetical protein